MFDDESCPPDRSACTGGLAEHFGAAGSWPLRAILQCPFWAIRSLWQNRFFACMLGAKHLWSALAYVERNPVRAGMVEQAAEYRRKLSYPGKHVCNTISL